MSLLPLVAWAAIASLSIALTLIIFYLTSALYMKRSRRKSDLAVSVGSQFAIQALSGNESDPGQIEVLRKSSTSVRLQIFHRLSAIVSGQKSHALEELADKIGITQEMERQATSRFWWRRLQAARFFNSINSHHELVTPFLHDSDTWVRAEAASWAGSHRDQAFANELVQILDEGNPFLRSITQEALAQYGTSVAEKISARINRDAPTSILIAFLTIAIYMKDPSPGIAALQLIGHHSVEVRRKLARLLGASGVNGAREALTAMLDDESSIIRIAACEGLAKLNHQQSAVGVSMLLADSDWEVRRAAAKALSELGPVGNVMLQSIVNKKSDGWDLARQRLDEVSGMELAA